MVTDEKGTTAAFGKMRRLRRNRRLSGVTYWATWAVAGLIGLLLLASAVVGLAAA
ncbi:MAG: hypothetical protein M3Z11_13160 [Candidatus Dormibacteraeota bacterium]|nr:hypothetical protein [Candidatus Dormibacteraeota bacterium]